MLSDKSTGIKGARGGVFWSFSEPRWTVDWGASRGVVGRFGDREGRSYYF